MQLIVFSIISMLAMVSLTLILNIVNIFVVRPQQMKIQQLEAAIKAYNIKLPNEVEKP